ncbi:hypothetical protein GCM10007301_15430 [Azorhizobium oxalatiphilum]|uniref:ATP-dependent Clp protease proteolytic subunit n=1 Tax=Azorhizobium oxalatiphilum TaxID=980631 RepID=A0A917BTX0_9HYPH|nr:head maturation protease, ClpP-related [Azorhizobium oxalatiphilum]GGF56657.1 hypothetical protein GCM10007301_15430 [Azorhizobium oxalatiphilum]
MAAIMDGGKLRLSGYVGEYFFEDGFTASDVVMALAGIPPGDELDVHLNSGGGIATEGAAIHAILMARPGTTNIVVEGIAASAASLIAMAGDTVTMAAGATMMIHDPATIAWGNADEHLKAVEELEAIATAYAHVYAAKSGKSAEDCRAIMKRETWFTPDQAVEAGFADVTAQGKARPVAVAAFDYRVFAHAPKRLVAMAKANNWSFGPNARATSSAPPRQQQEPSMTVETNGGVDAAEMQRLREENAKLTAEKGDRERRDAIAALPEAKGREAMAKALADSGVSIEQAKAGLAAAPAPTAEGSEDETGTDPTAYDRRRATAAGLNSGKPPAKKGDRAVLAAAVARTNKRR